MNNDSNISYKVCTEIATCSYNTTDLTNSNPLISLCSSQTTGSNLPTTYSNKAAYNNTV